MLLSTLGTFSLPKKAGAQSFIIVARASNRKFLRPPSGLLLTGEGLCHIEFQGELEDAQNWFVGSADVKNAFHQMRIPRWFTGVFLHCPLFSQEKRSIEDLLLPTP